MRVFKLLVIFLVSLSSGLSAKLSDEGRMVIDVASSYEKPTAVLVHVCWKFSEKYSLVSELMTSNKTVRFVSELKEVKLFEPITTMIVVDLNCDGSRSFLEQANKDDVFSKPYRWLIIANVDEFTKSTELTALKILVNSEFMIAEKTENNRFMLKLLYRIDMSSSYISEIFGIWSTVDGCQISEFVAQNSMVIRRKDLNGKAIAASNVITDNRTRTDIHLLDRDLNRDDVAKVSYHVVEPLYDFMNATQALVFTNTWGYFANNSWNGMMGDIDSGRGELCGTVSFMSLARIGIIQYISQPVPSVTRFLFRDPPLSFQNNLFILPFRGDVWLCIGGLIVILVVIIYMNAKWEKAQDEEAVMNDSTILKPYVRDIGILVISAITQQGNTNELKGSLGRLVTFIMFLIFLFLYASYAANIVALLQSNSNQIRTLTDLLNSSLELGVENETYNRYYFPRIVIMRVFKLLVVILIPSSEIAGKLSDEGRMVVDVVSSYENPTAILINVCWKFSEKYSLVSQLMTSNKTARFVSELKEVKRFEPITTLIVVDLNCDGRRSFLEQANKDDVFSKPYRWLIIANVDEFTKSTELTALKILVNSEVMIAEKTENNRFMLKLLYRIDMNSSYISEKFGIWSTVDGCQISEFVDQNSMVIRRKDLNRKAIAASHVITDNRTRTDIHVLDRDLKRDDIAKVSYHVVEPLYDFMNATQALVFTNTWGYFANNSWNGMMGDIDSGRAELCGTISFMSLARIGIIQYISQPVPSVPKFLFRDPPLSFQNNLFILPFRGDVWLCIGGLVVILVGIIYMNAKWEKAQDDEAVMNDSTILKPYVSDIGILVISAITQQGNTNELKGSLGRLVTFIMFLIFLFLYASYAANIVALLQSNSNQIRTLTDLLNSRLELGVENETYNRYYFPAATEPVRKAIYENKVSKIGYKPNFMSLREGVSKLRNKAAPFAFHMNLGMGYKIVEEMFHEHEKCDLHEIAYYPNARTWTCAKKASPYKEIYKVGINRLNEHGLNDRVSRVFYVRKPVCTMRGGNFASVTMVDFHPVLLWMVYGMALSVFLLVVEVLVHRKQNSEKKKQLEGERKENIG